MTPVSTRRASTKRKEDQLETTEDSTGEEEKQNYTRDDVVMAMNRVCEYLRTRAGSDCCLNIDKKVTGTCACVFQVLERSTETGEEESENGGVQAGDEIAAWFNSTSEIEQRSFGNSDPVSFMTDKYVKCVEADPINNGQQFTKLVYMDIPVSQRRTTKEGNWNGHDWDVGEHGEGEESLHTKMCVPSVLLLWKILVGGEEWDSRANSELRRWRKINYQQVLVRAGVISEQICKQKMRQRLFYARLEDYMDSGQLARRIPFERAFAKYKEMKWVDDELTEGTAKRRLARNWDQWKLSSIHIVRAGSNMDYQESTKALVRSLKMGVRNISAENMDFLEELFLYVMENTKKKPEGSQGTRNYCTQPSRHVPIYNQPSVQTTVIRVMVR
jgi:hypothetical protein